MLIEAHLVTSDAAAAADWYGQAFGAVERHRIPLPGGRTLAVAMRLGESVFHIASEFPGAGIVSPLTIGGTATVLQVNTDDARALWERAIAAGAQVRHALADTFWGELHGQLTDPFGHRWNIAQTIRDVPAAEVAAAAAQIFA
jgi:uncharacterized glyoxalase superfamily protein PhnB